MCVCLTTGYAARAAAQTVTDPQIVEFIPSPDHFVVDGNGQALVNHYDLAIYEVGSSNPFEVANIGKPSPDVDGRIRVSLSMSLSVWPLPLLAYEARVSAVGPTGNGDSDWSNPFMFSGPCSYSVAVNNQTFAATGGSATANVTTGAGCTWSAGTAAAWVTMGGTGGTGSGNVGFTVAANASSLGRSASVNVASQSIPITQAGVPCTYAVSPTGQSFPASGGTGAGSVATPAGCVWTPVSNAAWLSPGAGGTGPGSIAYAVAANSSTSSRTGTLTVGGSVLTVTQAAAVACTYALNPSSKRVGSGEITITASLTTQVGCAWQAATGASWLTVLTTSGTGSANVSVRVAKFTGKGSRTGTVTIGGLPFDVTQK
jgi:hypothetical protein